MLKTLYCKTLSIIPPFSWFACECKIVCEGTEEKLQHYVIALFIQRRANEKIYSAFFGWKCVESLERGSRAGIAKSHFCPIFSFRKPGETQRNDCLFNPYPLDQNRTIAKGSHSADRSKDPKELIS